MTLAQGMGASDLAPFKKMMLQSCGFVFENEREQTLAAAISRRMAVRKVGSHRSYHQLLVDEREELLQLTELLTVNETYFFREPDHLNLLVGTLLPELMALRDRQQVRILSAGCSTGEEPYTIAIMLRECFGEECEQRFAITGIDIDQTAIAAAREGSYGKSAFRLTDPSLIDRYFLPHGPGRFRVSDTIKRQVAFEAVNLLDESLPQRLPAPDIILYRNVSIYFPRPIQLEIFGRLAGLLSENGCLLVGASETMHHDTGILTLTKQNALFFFRKTPAFVVDERRSSMRHPLSPHKKKTLLQGMTPRPPAADAAQKTGGSAGGTGRVAPPPPLQLEAKEGFDAAVELARLKQYERALALAAAVIDRDPGFVKAHCLKASLLITLSRFEEAGRVCTEVLGRDALCLEAYLMLGIIARQQGNDAEALKRFREALYLNSACWPAHFFTAEIALAQKDEKRARSSFEAALRVLEKGEPKAQGQAFFPLSFNAEQFMLICRHKLSLLRQDR